MTTTPRHIRARIDFAPDCHARGIVTHNHMQLSDTTAPRAPDAAEALHRLAALYSERARMTFDATEAERLAIAAEDLARLADVADAYANLRATRHARALRAGV